MYNIPKSCYISLVVHEADREVVYDDGSQRLHHRRRVGLDQVESAALDL